jgi:hypothetical protein
MAGFPELQRKRAVLQARSNVLRHRLQSQLAVAQAPLAQADRWRERLGGLLARPHWVGAAAALLVLLRPARALRWGTQAWAAWRFWRQLRRRF